MDRALLVLWRLKLRGFFRRWGKNLRKPKGILLTVVGLLVFLPWMLSIVLAPRQAMPWDPEKVRRFGPLALLAYAALTLFFSSGERVLFFQPAEIDFLFPGPFTRRSLLAYKIVGAVFGILFSSLFLLMAFVRSSHNPLAAYAAIVLAMLFFQFLGMAVGLASNTVAVLATGFRRRAILAGLLALGLATVWSAGAEVLRLPPDQAWARVESSPALRAATMPFQPFIYAYTAGSLPEALAWSAACLGMVALLLGAVFAIDAQYLETAAASSARLYAQIQRMRQGGGMMPGRGSASAKARRARSRLPMLPWWGGVGPVLWRQLATALREKVRLTFIALALIVPTAVTMFARNDPNDAALGRVALYMIAGMVVYGAGFFSAFVAFDFRGDVDRMEELKALPIRPVPLVLGQLATPVLVFCAPAWAGFALIAARTGVAAADVVFLALIAPLSALFLGIDNLLFLLFPTRSTQATVADFASMGRQILLVLAKFLLGGITIGLSALLGVVVHYLTGGSLLAAYLAALALMTAAAASLVPFLALAFEKYDVAGDTPA